MRPGPHSSPPQAPLGASPRGLTPSHLNPLLPQTELVDGEEHDHTVTSRISLVDLAGSERQGPAGTSGQQLRVKGLPGGRGLFPGEGLAPGGRGVLQGEGLPPGPYV